MPRGLADSLPDVIFRYVSWAVCQTLLVGTHKNARMH